MFIGRERELATLNKLYESDKFEFVVIYGRRRVGKTALISQFIDDKNAIYFMGVESNAKQNLENFSKSILSYHTGMDAETSFLSFQAALEYVFKLSEKERIILAIDEYPYVARSSKSLASTIQLLIDQYKDTSKLMLILCGSSMSYMEDHVLAYKAPLYGRRTAQMKILPFDFAETCHYFKNFTDEEKAYVYGIVGGTPQYLLQMSDKLSIENNIKNTFLNPNSALFEEPENLLKQEVREPALYNAIITAIATGASRMSEISGKVGEDTMLANIIRMVREAGASKAPIQKLADRVAAVFVPVVVGIALVTFLVWILVTRDFYTAFNFSVSVLVISCPCALGLATPVAIMAATGRGASFGILYKNAESLQRAADVGVVLLDKTAGGYAHSTLFQLPTKMGKGILVVPTVSGNIMLGPTAADVDDKDCADTTFEGLEEAFSKARRTVPSLDKRAVITQFTGLRAHSETGDFEIGFATCRQMYNIVGIESPGLTAAPAIATAAAEEIAAAFGLERNEKFVAQRKAPPSFAKMTDEQRAELIAKDPLYGKIVCRCENVTEGEIVDAIRRPVGAKDLDGIKRRTRAGMGRCQGGFCTPRVMEILARELGCDVAEVTKNGKGSEIVVGRIE